ncbi:MAG TPA: glycosyltransferase, partial [Ligilactobacillus acidipiscis]|nr:glycosyltransferase [Ligilactobacillus acidipiscis]
MDKDNITQGLVTVIMPAYNSEKYIEQSIESVINQTYGKWELFVIDDFSNDRTVEKVQKYHDERIKLIKLEQNSGVAHARNVGIKHANGEYTA